MNILVGAEHGVHEGAWRSETGQEDCQWDPIG